MKTYTATIRILASDPPKDLNLLRGYLTDATLLDLNTEEQGNDYCVEAMEIDWETLQEEVTDAKV
jgi:hypothetical protein